MRRPLIIVAIFYVCGLLLAEIEQPPLWQLLGLGAGLLVLALIWGRARPWLLIPLLILVGWANLVSRTSVVSPHDLRTLLSEKPAEVALRGTLVETPSVRMFLRDEKESFRTLTLMEVQELKSGGNWVPAHGRVMTVTPDSLEGVMFRGSEVEVRGVIAPPQRPVAPGLFDYRTYLERQEVYFQLKAYSIDDWRLTAGITPPLADRFTTWAKRVLSRGQPEQDEPLRLLFAMILGWRTGLTDEVYEPFMQSGTMHIFAISGLHIALIAGLLVAMLRMLQIPRHWCGLLVIPLIWFYTAATGWQASAIRSTIMMTIIVGGWSLSRPTDLLNSLAAAALIILVWQPRQLFQASFQLSFFVVLSIALLMPPIKRFGDRLIEHDPLLPREVLPRWRRIQQTGLRWLVASFATSLAAWLGALPLTAHYFHLFSPVTLLANLLIVPLSGAALASALGSLMCGDWLPWVGELFNHSAWFWMSLMVRVSHWATTLPGAFRYVPSPPAWTFMAYYGLLAGALSGWFFKRQNRLWGLTVVVFALAGVGWEWHRALSRINITVLPLNGGHAVLVDGPGTRDDWLVDCGGSNAVQFVTVPFLRSQGFNRLPKLALTHGDLQHVGGTRLLCEAFPVEEIYTGPTRFRSPVYRGIIRDLAASPGRHKTIALGDRPGPWRVVHPAEDDHFSQADDASLGLLGHFHGMSVLLLGDLGRPGDEQMLQRFAVSKADIVITGLPERGEPVGNDLIDTVRPELIVVADSEFPATKRAPLALRGRLARRHVPVIYTRESGAVTLLLTPSGWSVQTMEPSPQPIHVPDFLAWLEGN